MCLLVGIRMEHHDGYLPTRPHGRLPIHMRAPRWSLHFLSFPRNPNESVAHAVGRHALRLDRLWREGYFSLALDLREPRRAIHE